MENFYKNFIHTRSFSIWTPKWFNFQTILPSSKDHCTPMTFASAKVQRKFFRGILTFFHQQCFFKFNAACILTHGHMQPRGSEITSSNIVRGWEISFCKNAYPTSLSSPLTWTFHWVSRYSLVLHPQMTLTTLPRSNPKLRACLSQKVSRGSCTIMILCFFFIRLLS